MNACTKEPKIPQVIETLDEVVARKEFSDIMMKFPRSTIELVEVPNGSPIYRITVIESSWGLASS